MIFRPVWDGTNKWESAFYKYLNPDGSRYYLVTKNWFWFEDG